MDIQRIKDLVDQFSDSALEGMRISSGDLDIEIVFATDAASPAPRTVAPAPVAENTVDISAPMAGLVYLSPSPDAAPFVTEGQRVDAGQTLVLIEAMKSMIPLTAPVAGTIAAITLQDGATCSAGQVLVTLKEGAA
ncbi:acetyl-CoA carboxylase biotin carboxyl carrier protein [Celeribacter sp.]|uniref:acetyl-CoA carboxylase biotin carboxyl carrier protein n=1 Tax=Celeribacter sp. TaxID=1890673 RepID=UPI003A8E60A2